MDSDLCFDYGVLGEILEIRKGDGLSLVVFTPDDIFAIHEHLNGDLVGLTTVFWEYSGNGTVKSGLDHVEVIDNGQTLHFLAHLAGALGYTINFETRRWDLQQLKFAGVGVIEPQPVA